MIKKEAGNLKGTLLLFLSNENHQLNRWWFLFADYVSWAALAAPNRLDGIADSRRIF